MAVATAGSFVCRVAANWTNFGKLSSNGPRTPFGYQIKCPMPSDAKFSPAFHEVSPATVRPHSFCQILFPIRRVSAGERFIAAVAWLVAATRRRKRKARQLDAR